MDTHDYREQRWGHRVTVERVLDNGVTLEVVGWGPLSGPPVKEGDVIVFRDAARFTMHDVRTADAVPDMPDMWWATLRRILMPDVVLTVPTRQREGFAWLPCRVSLPDGSTRWTWLTPYLLVEVQRTSSHAVGNDPTDGFDTTSRWEPVKRVPLSVKEK